MTYRHHLKDETRSIAALEWLIDCHKDQNQRNFSDQSQQMQIFIYLLFFALTMT